MNLDLPSATVLMGCASRLRRQTVTVLVILVISDPIEGQEAALMPASMAAGPVSFVV